MVIRITVDPGHGGKQPGAVGPTGVQEKNVCLAVALRVRELLRIRGHADMYMTRETDIDVPLSNRLPAADAACYISIHCNAAKDRSANGTETFYRVGGHIDSKRLAEILQRNLLRELRLRDRGVKTAAFQVIRQAKCPAVLVELGFISNHAEEALLESEEGQERAARAIAAGVAEFIGVRLQPASPQAQPVAPPTGAAKSARKSHVVTAGDTLWSISRQYGVTSAQLRQWNNLRTDLLRVGQILFLSEN